MSLREQKKKELQEKIQVAARELFLEKEFDNSFYFRSRN